MIEAETSALRKIAALAVSCSEGDCDDNYEDGKGAHRVATHETTLWGAPVYLCEKHAADCVEAHRKAESKGCGKQPDVIPYEQGYAIQIAMNALSGGVKMEAHFSLADITSWEWEVLLRAVKAHGDGALLDSTGNDDAQARGLFDKLKRAREES